MFNTFLPICYKYLPSLLIAYDWVLEESNNLAESSKELMQIQYDLPEKMFTLMLGEGELIYPKYSMALWEKGALNLEQAQIQMLDDLMEKVGIQDGDKILDIGCGWGCLSNYILSKFPHVKVTGVNLSKEQCTYIRRKIKNTQSYLSSERFTLYEGDFNQIVLAEKFDKIITVGVFEHIGNLTKSLSKLASFLEDNGKVFIHIISSRLSHNIFSPFLNKYIFPRARIWHYEAIPECNQDLKTIDKWYLNGSNYSQTLQNWLHNFDQNQEEIKTFNYGIKYAKFRRIWRLYLLWCIAYFDSCHGEILGNGQYLMVHNFSNHP